MASSVISKHNILYSKEVTFTYDSSDKNLHGTLTIPPEFNGNVWNLWTDPIAYNTVNIKAGRMLRGSGDNKSREYVILPLPGITFESNDMINVTFHIPDLNFIKEIS